MATAPSKPRPVLGRVDPEGRLVSADAELEALQVDAGSRLGGTLAIPQIAAIARLARTLGIAVTRRAIAADAEHDIELSVRAVPEGDEVALIIEDWVARPAAGPRLASLLGPESNATPEAAASFEWSSDAELRLTSVSGDLAIMLGTQAGEAIGQPLTRLFRLEENDEGEMPLLSAVASRRAFAGQPARSRHCDPAPRLLLSADALSAPDGAFAGFSGQAVPLDELQAGEQDAIAPPDQFDDVLDEALRTPLDRIIQAAERIAGRADGSLRSDYTAYAGDISTAARHLLSVIESMGEQRSEEHGTVDLAALAAEAVVMLEPTAEERHVTIVMETSRALPARGEAGAVIQILVNLIGNAVRHSPEGGTVTLRFRRSAEQSCVIVLDDGPGIDPADQQRIFERFERATPGEDGTGLGLAISRRLGRSMGGDIELESAPNAGARFTLRLPSA
jgi:signal transduction histidine kinase